MKPYRVMLMIVHVEKKKGRETDKGNEVVLQIKDLFILLSDRNLTTSKL